MGVAYSVAANGDTVLADLPPEVLEAVAAQGELPSAPAQLLELVYGAAAPYEFDAGALIVRSDQRWFSSLPEPKDGAPVAEVRRWPGDTVLALYAIEGPLAVSPENPPAFAGAELSLDPDATPDRATWRGTVRTRAGERSVVWIEHRIGDAPAILGALLAPGDAGLGEEAQEPLLSELRSVLERIEIRTPVWRVKKGNPRGAPLRLPILGDTPELKDESTSPWQVARARAFTIGLPPGLRARRMDGGVPPPVPLPGGMLWVRGRFVDIEGKPVTIGDSKRFGYVAHVPGKPKEWLAGKAPPVGAPGASRSASQPFPLVSEHVGARSGRAERWEEPGFSGQWLVFRLELEKHGVEVGLPVLEGHRSPSLFWIPLTWRPAGYPPAPPPIDPAERFGIRYERFSRAEQSNRPWSEGYLIAPGLRVELPKGWWPAASLRSGAGYPIRLVDRSGVQLGLVIRLEADDLPDVSATESGWEPSPRPGVHRAAATYSDPSGRQLYVHRDGFAFLFEQSADTDGLLEAWGRMSETIQLMGLDKSN